MTSGGWILLAALAPGADSTPGARFAIRRIHDAVLSVGVPPLDVLARHGDRFIAAEAGRP
jgi:uncharacterized protein (DUF885 family)